VYALTHLRLGAEDEGREVAQIQISPWQRHQELEEIRLPRREGSAKCVPSELGDRDCQDEAPVEAAAGEEGWGGIGRVGVVPLFCR